MFLKRYQQVLLFIGLYILGVVVYGRGLGASYYYDDFLRVFTNPHEAIWQGFVKANYLDKFYRPLETMVMAFVQIVWDRNTLPIHLLNLFFHTCLAVLVYRILTYWKVRKAIGIGIATYMLVSQMSVGAVLGNDLQSQLVSSLCSVLSLWLLYQWGEGGRQDRSKYYSSILFFFLALISKETATGVVGSICLVGAILPYSDKASKRWVQWFWMMVPYGVAAIVYLVLRFSSGGSIPKYGSYDYSFRFGVNIIENIVQFGVQSILPLSSIALIKAIRLHQYVNLSIIGFASIVTSLILVLGLRLSADKKKILVLLAILFFSWCPAIFLNHISEPYNYNALPLIAILWGLSLEQWWQRKSALWKKTISVALSLILAANIIAVDEKARAMKREGDRADILLPEVIAYVPAVPRDGMLCLVDPREEEFKYTTYTLGGFRVIACSDSLVHYYSKRPDVILNYIQDAEVYHYASLPSAVFVTYDTVTLKLQPYSK